MLYLVGLGLSDAEDITVKGLAVVKKAKKVYLEAYTSILTVGKEKLEEFYGREVVLADRETVEQLADDILGEASSEDVALLVVGDPFGATTHADFILRAHQAGVKFEVIHNASIMNAVGCCGLQLYSFGETVSLVFWTDSWQPESYYDKICSNHERGLHTLCLLDIKMKEQSVENMMRGRKVYEPPRFMTVKEAAGQLVTIARRRAAATVEEIGDIDVADGSQRGPCCVTEDCLAVGLARVGSSAQKIATGTLLELSSCDLGEPLHSLVVVGKLHCIERDMLRLSAVNEESFDELTKDVN